MSRIAIFVLLLLLSCVPAARAQSSPDLYYWTGTIDGKIPIFMWLAEQDSLLIGEIVYTQTKTRTPIKLSGFIDPAHPEIRINEYQPDGVITGIITISKIASSASGTWFSPKSRKEFPLELHRNQATIDRDTIELHGNQFQYFLRDSPACSFRVRFYNHFVVIRYPGGHGSCNGIFGYNATVEGVFLKVSSKPWP